MNEKDLSLLVDLSKLLKKYGADVFKSLSTLLSNPENIQILSDILSHMVISYRNLPASAEIIRDRNITKIPQALTALEANEPEKYHLLSQFYLALVSKTYLPSLKDLKIFVAECGLPEIKSKSRQKAINPVISSMIFLPISDLKSRLDAIEKKGSNDRSLEGWSDIILKNPRSIR